MRIRMQWYSRRILRTITKRASPSYFRIGARIVLPPPTLGHRYYLHRKYDTIPPIAAETGVAARRQIDVTYTQYRFTRRQ